MSGLSVDAVVNNYKQQEAAYRAALNKQQEMKDVQAGLALTDAGFRSINNQIRINKPIRQPSAALAVIDGVGRIAEMAAKKGKG